MKYIKYLLLSFVFALAGAIMLPLSFVPTSPSAEDVTLEETISSASDFVRVMSSEEIYDNTLASIKLTSDIDLQGQDLTAVWEAQQKDFKGTFDGCGYSILNLSISSNTANYGFFGSAVGATIKDLRLDGELSITIDDTSAKDVLSIGVLVGSGNGVTISNCEIGEVIVEENSSRYIDISVGNIGKKFNFGFAGGKLSGNSNVKNLIIYANATLPTNISLENSLVVGGAFGSVENASILNVAYQGNINISVDKSVTNNNLTIYAGGIIGQIQGNQTSLRNTSFVGSLRGENSSGQISSDKLIAGGVVGRIAATGIKSGNINYNYWSAIDYSRQQLRAFGQGDYTQSQGAKINYQENITSSFFTDKSSWYTLDPWDFKKDCMYKDGVLKLQVFQEFAFNFGSLSSILRTNSEDQDNTTFNGGRKDIETGNYIYKHGAEVEILLIFNAESQGYYRINQTDGVSRNAGAGSIHEQITKSDYKVSPVISIDGKVVRGYKVTFQATDFMAGNYTFTFEPVPFKCEVVVEEGQESIGGVMHQGGSEPGKSLPLPLTVSSNVQRIVAQRIEFPENKFDFAYWTLFNIAEDGTESEVSEFGQYSNPTIEFKFGGIINEDDTISRFFKQRFKLVAHFSDEKAIKVTFGGYNDSIITEIVLNNELYRGSEIRVAATRENVNMQIVVASGYELDVDGFINYMSEFGLDGRGLRASHRETEQEDGSIKYSFNNINMALIKNALGDNALDLNVRLSTKVKVVENQGSDLTWLWVTLPIVGVVLIAGGVVAFLLIRRRNMYNRMNNGGGSDNSVGGNPTANKVKKTKAKEVDYKDYYS